MFRRLLWLLLLTLGCSSALACGPFFPNMMLVGGDEPVFTAPVAHFYDELARLEKRLKIPRPPFPVVESTNDLRAATRELDVADLQSALRKSGLPKAEIASIVRAYNTARDAMLEYAAAMESYSAKKSLVEWLREAGKEPSTAPKFPAIEVPAGLPPEFADYFRGAMAWHRGQTNAARTAWQALLERTPSERHYKSTWAAFMLAKSWESENKVKALGYYTLVRELAKEGFADSLGLAASSIGWQARVHLQNNEFESAIERYLEQLAMDDGTAYTSLRMTASKALHASPEVLDRLAKNPRTRAVLTAQAISSESSWWHEPYEFGDNGNARPNPLHEWLRAVERAKVTDMELADQLALASYQAGQFEAAQRWVKRAPTAPVSQWIQAKLLLHDGKVDKAASILARLTRVFPLIEPTNSTKATLPENLYVPNGDGTELSIGRQALGELGVLHLHRKEYVQALDALLRAGFWLDAAYVAERVLMVEELQSYVDHNWPDVLKDEEEDERLPHDMKLSVQSERIRHLLAHRLTRLGQSVAARPYVPERWLAKFDELMLHLALAQDESRPGDERATNYWRAAWIVRTNGIELIGTEVEPDYAIWAGRDESSLTVSYRATNAAITVTGASADEVERGENHNVDPEMRYHYRWHAAALALEGAKLLPNNSDFTARVLYDGGSFIKYLDPDTADIFYKLLVRRCRKTELGDAADRQRWFPPFDANGKPMVTRKPPNEAPLPVPEETVPALEENSEIQQP